MFDDTGVEDLISSIVTIVWFVASLSLLLFITAKGYTLSTIVKETVTSNETIIGTSVIEAQYGYYDGQEIKYDGSLQGYEVFASIINNKENIDIYVKNPSGIVKLNSITIYQRNFMDYVQNVDQTKLKKYIDTNAVYTRQYTINAHGNVVKVVYEKME